MTGNVSFYIGDFFFRMLATWQHTFTQEGYTHSERQLIFADLPKNLLLKLMNFTENSINNKLIVTTVQDYCEIDKLHSTYLISSAVII